MKKYVLLAFVMLLALGSCVKKHQVSHTLRDGKGGKKFGGTLNVNETGDLRSLDPPQINDQTSSHIAENIYDRLIEFDSVLNFRPCLARALPEISADGITYTFHLRNDVYFQDDPCFPNGKGRKFTAQDVVYSWTRCCDPRTNTLALPYFQVIRGAKEYFDSKASLSGVSGLKAPDDTTLVVTLVKPFSPFINYCTVGAAYIYAHEAVEYYGKDFTHHGVGTGPYRFLDYKEGRYCLLARNEHYWQHDDAGNKLPYIDSVKFSFIQDDKSELLEFKAGKLDHKYRIPNEFFNDVVDQDKHLVGEYKQYQLARIAALATQFHGFNCMYPGVSNVHLRRAIAFAIDRRKIVKYVLRGQAFSPGEHGLVPPGMPGYPFDSVHGFVFNPDSARAELEIAKHELDGNIPDLTLYVNKGGGRNQDVAQAVQGQIKENLGIDVHLEVKEWSQLTPMVDDGKAAYFRLGWIADYPDPQNFLNLLYSKNIPSSGPSSINQTRYRNPEFDKIYEQAMSETDRATVLRLLAKCDQLAIVDAPQVILYYDEDYHLIQPWVRNFPINAQDNNPFKWTWFSE
ncbi:MAG TPA: ABC transporter substrate-binding protein [Candidatus Kapabacteria bacterium]|nr:ABC transporter substrate-binding protein [Candidatus Kapabacteria bacterium]